MTPCKRISKFNENKRGIRHGTGTEQDNLLDDAGQQILRQEAGDQGPISFLFSRSQDRRSRSEWFGQEFTAQDHGRRGQGLQRRGGAFAGVYRWLPGTGTATGR